MKVFLGGSAGSRNLWRLALLTILHGEKVADRRMRGGSVFGISVLKQYDLRLRLPLIRPSGTFSP